MPFTACKPGGCHGCELQSFHSISKYLQRTISCLKNDKSLTQRWNILVLVNYFRGVELCRNQHSNMLQQHDGLGKLAQFRKFKIKADCSILRALAEAQLAQWGCHTGGHSLVASVELGIKSSIQENTTWHYPKMCMIR